MEILVRSVAGTKKNCVANETLRPVTNMPNVRSHTCLSQPYREKASTMLMVAPVVKNWMRRGWD